MLRHFHEIFRIEENKKSTQKSDDVQLTDN